MPARPNFLGRPAKGYEAAVCILTEPRRQGAGSKVQKHVASEGLTLVVFDCYRPIRAVDDFVGWTRQGGPPDPRWYPKVKRGDLIAEGYIGERSSHSRGSTVDVALGPADVRRRRRRPTPIAAPKRPARSTSAPASTASTSAATPPIRRCRRPPSPTARSWSPPCSKPASATIRTNGGTSR